MLLFLATFTFLAVLFLAIGTSFSSARAFVVVVVV
jgi:hypothetical protein